MSDAPSRLQSIGAKLQQVDPAGAKRSASGGVDAMRDAARLTVDYVKQETLDPLRSLGRQIALGAAGAITMGLGLVLLMLGALRGIQTLFGANDPTGRPMSGNNTWIPYLLAVLVCVVVLALIGLGFRSTSRTRASLPRSSDPTRGRS
jgi:hypothetical protein